MDTSYDKVISYLTEEQGLSLKEAEEIMVLCVEQGMNPTEIFGRGLVDMLNLLPKKKKVEPAKPQPTGTPAQGNLLTKKGTAQNFTGGRTPFTSTSPVPAASSPLPKPPTKPAVSPGQMRIAGMSDRAQDLRNVTRNPNLGLPGNTSGFGGTSPLPKPKPPVSNSLGQAIQNLGNRAYATAATPSTMPRGTRLTRGLKGLAPQIGAEIGGALLEPVAKAAGNELGKALTRGVASVTGTTDKVKAALPSYYGAKGPDVPMKYLKQGVKSSEPKQPRRMSNIPPAEGMVNNPDYGKPGSISSTPKPEAPKPAPKPPTAKERAYGARSKLTAAQQELNRQYDIDRGLEGGRVTKPFSSALDNYLAKRKK